MDDKLTNKALIEKAFEKWWKEMPCITNDDPYCMEKDMSVAFQAGATWQREQLESGGKYIMNKDTYEMILELQNNQIKGRCCKCNYYDKTAGQCKMNWVFRSSQSYCSEFSTQVASSVKSCDNCKYQAYHGNSLEKVLKCRPCKNQSEWVAKLDLLEKGGE